MTDTKPRVERWTFTFEPLPDEVPVAVRMRLLLKTALRRLRLKCVGISGERTGTDGPSQHQ